MGYMQTLPCSPVLDGDYGVYAMDCEMVSDTFCKRSSPTLSLCFFHSCFKQTYLEIMCTLFGHVILIHWNIIMLCWTGLYSRWSGACSSHRDRQWKQLGIRDFSEARSENYWSQHQVTRLIFCPNIYMKSVLLSFQVFFFKSFVNLLSAGEHVDFSEQKQIWYWFLFSGLVE